MTHTPSEREWLNALARLPVFRPGCQDLTVIAPHPDDEILGAGGLIADHRRRGLDVSVIAVTDGEAAYPGEANLARTRQAEQENALAQVGVPVEKIRRLRLPDGEVALQELELTSILQDLLREPSLVVAPWARDPHPDHEACGRAAASAARKVGATLLSYFFWAWHKLPKHAVESLTPYRFELDQDLQDTKNRALSEYRSQLYREEGDAILPEPLLAPARRSFETFAIDATTQQLRAIL